MAAGSGERFGSAKQYEPLAGRRVLDWAVAAARSSSEGVVLVVPPERAGDPELMATLVVGGGPTRSASVRRGLEAVPADTRIVVVHDAARPLASPFLFATVIAAVGCGADGAVPGLALVDTVKRVGPDDAVTETIDRDRLVAVQTPQAFAAGVLRAAHEAADDATDDAALVERRGGRVVVVPGEHANRKLTHPSDLAAAEAWLTARPPKPPGAAPSTPPEPAR